MGPLAAAWLARFLSTGLARCQHVAGMAGGVITVPTALLIQIAPDPFWAFVLYAPALLAVNSPFGIANGALPVITPTHLRARVAAVYMLTGAIGMDVYAPGRGHERAIFPGIEGVRHCMITMVLLLGCPRYRSLLWLRA